MPLEYKAVSADTIAELNILVNAELVSGFKPNYPVSVCACPMGDEMMLHFAQGLVKVTV